ncbi:MAG: hypothetical protein HY343_03250 [Lentisphaerae bacterium]|nr:hypothetical protein [Lentisphaerota bacterium]
MLTNRDNYLRNARFQTPEWIPAVVHVSDASWNECRGELEAVALRHPEFFPAVKPGWRDYDRYVFRPGQRKDEPVTDVWGCVWISAQNGIEGTVHNAPLAEWDALETWRVPDANTTGDRAPADWKEIRESMAAARRRQEPAQGWLQHGFLFLRLCYLRGFENVMLDIAGDEPRLRTLIAGINVHNLTIVRNYLDIGIDLMEFPEDLGTQTSTFISPADFRKWLKPAYQQLMDPCKAAGVLVAFHSDGRTLDILEDQIAAGVDIVNPQDLCNGIDNLARTLKGKACIRLDIDRQTVLPFGSRKDIHALIEEEVRKLGDPRGGLEFIAGIYPPTPPQNVDALCEALKKFQRFWW